MATHTPGPWALDPTHLSVAAGSRRIASVAIPAHAGVAYPSDTKVADANARLIAAAPDMLAALQAALEALDASQPLFNRYPEPVARHREATKAAIAAIAKATGA